MIWIFDDDSDDDDENDDDENDDDENDDDGDDNSKNAYWAPVMCQASL